MPDANATDLNSTLTNDRNLSTLQTDSFITTLLSNITDAVENVTDTVMLAPQLGEKTSVYVAENVTTAHVGQSNFTDIFYNHTLATLAPDGEDFFHHLSTKDETLFVGLIILGFIIPILFIAIFSLVCIRRRKEKKARRSERLLRNAQELAMDDYPPAMYKIQSMRA